MQKLRPDMDIGKNIRNLRNRTKLTQEQAVAKMNILGIDISVSTYAKIETNRMNIKISELMALKKIYKAEIADFFEGLDDEIAEC